MTTAVAATVVAGLALCGGLLALAKRKPAYLVVTLALLCLYSDPWLLLPLATAALIAGVAL